MPAPLPTRLKTRALFPEIIRQWSTFHPEFSYLPRKFKIAVTGQRATARPSNCTISALSLCAMRLVRLVMRFMLAAVRGAPSLPKNCRICAEGQTSAYLEAVMRVYNMLGGVTIPTRHALKFWHETGEEEMRRLVEAEFAQIDAGKMLEVPQAELDRITRYFGPPKHLKLFRPKAPHSTKPKPTMRALRNGAAPMWWRTNNRAIQSSIYH